VFARSLLIHQSPALLLHTALRGIEHHELAALLQLGVANDEVLTLVVVGDVFGGGFVGMHPLGG